MHDEGQEKVQGRVQTALEWGEAGGGGSQGGWGGGSGRQGGERTRREVSGRMTLSAGPGTGEILDGGLCIIPEGLGASPFPSLDLSFPSVTWDS